MVDIGSSGKITNLWPVPPSRLIEKSKLKDNSSQNKQRNNKQKDDTEITQESGPGKNIDEYA